MTEFNILSTNDPFPYKEQIVGLWDNALPGTAHGRLEWMSRGNPAGKSNWFLALEEKTGNLAGSVSVMPKEFLFNKNVLRCGIIGDIMVEKQFRGCGLAAQIIQTALDNLHTMGLQCAYVVPNSASEKIFQMVGFKKVAKLRCLVKPISVRYYLEKYAGCLMATVFTPFLDTILRHLSRENYCSSRGIRMEAMKNISFFDVLLRKFLRTQSGATANRDFLYLDWRYHQNPQYRFHNLGVSESDGNPLAYVYYTVNSGQLEIFDMVSLDKRYILLIVKTLAGIAISKKCHAIYCWALENCEFTKNLKRCNFMRTSDYLPVYFFGEDDSMCNAWDFFAGDRNI